MDIRKRALMVGAFGLAVVGTASAQVIAQDDFSYADGSLVPNGGWVSHSGTAGDLQVSGGQVVVQHGSPSEDANLPFTAVAGNIWFGIDVSVIDVGAPYAAGGDYEYFAHFKDSGFGFCARLDVVPPSGGGDFSFGISSDGSTADVTWPTDLTYGTTYRVVARYDQDLNIAECWVDPSASTDASILGDDQSDPGDVVVGFALRQSDSTENEGVLVDNLIVGQTFADVVGGGCPAGAASETVRLGTPPNPNAFMPGATSGPVLGGTWDPFVDHSTFATGALFDFAIITVNPTNIPLPGGLGTLLCDPAVTIATMSGAPGAAFSVPVPSDCAFVGVTVSTQGASLSAGGVAELANALDLVLGTS